MSDVCDRDPQAYPQKDVRGQQKDGIGFCTVRGWMDRKTETVDKFESNNRIDKVR